MADTADLVVLGAFYGQGSKGGWVGCLVTSEGDVHSQTDLPFFAPRSRKIKLGFLGGGLAAWPFRSPFCQRASPRSPARLGTEPTAFLLLWRRGSVVGRYLPRPRSFSPPPPPWKQAVLFESGHAWLRIASGDQVRPVPHGSRALPGKERSYTTAGLGLPGAPQSPFPRHWLRFISNRFNPTFPVCWH